jgi:hypothetical protein
MSKRPEVFDPAVLRLVSTSRVYAMTDEGADVNNIVYAAEMSGACIDVKQTPWVVILRP